MNQSPVTYQALEIVQLVHDVPICTFEGFIAFRSNKRQILQRGNGMRNPSVGEMKNGHLL